MKSNGKFGFFIRQNPSRIGKNRTFAASIVERFDLIATTRKNAKPMLFPTTFSQYFPHKFIIN